MIMAPATELRIHHPRHRGDLLDVYADVRAPLLHLPNYAVTAFGERLDRQATEPGFAAVLAYADGHPVSYAYDKYHRARRPLLAAHQPGAGRQVHRASGRGPEGDRCTAGLAQDRHRPPCP